MDFNSGQEKFSRFKEKYPEKDRNEATTRLHLIDNIFFECLGWERESCTAEDRFNGEYTDYTFKTNHPKLIVEAKREGKYFDMPIEKAIGKNYLISTLCKNNRGLKSAVEQTISYCQSRGVEVGCVTNGHQFVIFLGTRTDGTPPMDGRCVIFLSLTDIDKRFTQFWNYLSPECIKQNILINELLDRYLPLLPQKLSAKLLSYPGIKDRNMFQADLKTVSEFILEDLLTGKAVEKDFLASCYCSSGALSQYALISKNVLKTRYESLFPSGSPAPTLTSIVTRSGISTDLISETISKRPLLLIGDVGAGKTIFIRNFINVSAFEELNNAVTLYIDLGSQGNLSRDLKDCLITEISDQLLSNYKIDIKSQKIVHSIYHGDIDRFKNGIYGPLEKSSPLEYLKKEIEYLEQRMDNNESHLRSCIKWIVRSHRKQVVIFIDNCDQRSYEDQQKAFLLAQEMASDWDCSIYVSLRPETFYRSKHSGTLSAYQPKAFTVSPPRVDEVIIKRLNFAIQYAKKIASEDIPGISGVMRETISKELIPIIISFLDSINTNRELLEAIDNISGGNIRKALDFFRSFLSSGHVDTEKILKIIVKDGKYQVPLHEFLRAIIYGDSKYYDNDRSPIVNLFDLSTYDPKEHFLLCVLLSLLQSLSKTGDKTGFVETASLVKALHDLGYIPEQIEFGLHRAVMHQLVDVTGRSKYMLSFSMEKEIPEALRLTTVGAYHIKKLIHFFTYHSAIIVDTPILIPDFRDKIYNVEEEDIKVRLDTCEIFIDYLDTQWEKSNIASEVFDWSKESRFARDDIFRVRNKAKPRKSY